MFWINEEAEVEEQDNTGSKQCDTSPGMLLITDQDIDTLCLGRWVDQTVKLSINAFLIVSADW